MQLAFGIKRVAAIALMYLFVAYPAIADDAPPFDPVVRPLLDTYCIRCHNADKLKGDLDIDRFKTRDMAATALGVWQRIAMRIANREMPPRNAEQPSDEERELLVKWIASLETKDDCNRIASEESVSWYPGFVMSRRINRTEYENTIRDLFGLPLVVKDFFPADGAGGEGFDNNGGALFLSAIQIEKYLEAADYAVETALPAAGAPVIPGQRRKPGLTALDRLPTDERQRIQAVRARIITEQPGWQRTPEDAAREVIRAFAYRAWRRPVEPAELDKLIEVFLGAYERGDSYYESIKLALKGVLASPHFIFLAEPEPEMLGDYPLGGYPLAARLSYFLWASAPDAELLQLAAQGLLQREDVLSSQVKRMLQDDKARALAQSFGAQWLGIVQLGETIKPDIERFPEFDDALLASMKQETEMFLHRIIREDRSLLELIDADYTYMDRRLAEIYGVQEVRSSQMQLVQLASAGRGGVLTMPAVLTATSHPLRTSPVLRGKWVLEQILGDRVPPPPPDAGTLPEDDHNEKGLTLREQLEAHRKNPDCASCHSRMDPIGFGLENFDPIGRWRDTQAGQPVDAQGVLPSGETFSGPQELKAILLARKDAFAANLSRKMLGYALGRELTQYDKCVIDRCVQALQQHEYRPSALFTEIVLSYPFRHRFSGGKATDDMQDEP